MVRISCPTKFHAFALADQLAKRNMLNKFYTLFYSRKNTFYAKFHTRKDLEKIDFAKVKAFPLLLPLYYLCKDFHLRATGYDSIVANELKKNKNYRVLIAWSGMSLKSITQAKKDGKLVILERGSSHILYQNDILKEEYKNLDKTFAIDPRTIETELEEYKMADYISTPSLFAENTLIKHGIKKEKIFRNPYGSYSFLKPKRNGERNGNILRILYLGSCTIRKGLTYLFQALKIIESRKIDYEFWMIGSVSAEMRNVLNSYNQSNWKIFGHINQTQLGDHISECDVAVIPSIEDGFGMVIPQILSCGIPIITTYNTGGADLIINGMNGFVIPIRNPEAIAEKLIFYNSDRKALHDHKKQCLRQASENISWDNYGNRYSLFIKSLT